MLAKRKTKAMKEMEEAAVTREENRGKSAARRAKLTQQFAIPDHTTTDYERQLKKIATRGGEFTHRIYMELYVYWHGSLLKVPRITVTAA